MGKLKDEIMAYFRPKINRPTEEFVIDEVTARILAFCEEEKVVIESISNPGKGEEFVKLKALKDYLK